MRLAIITAHAGAESLPQARESWQIDDLLPVNVMNGDAGMLVAYQRGLDVATEDILAHLHDDFILHENPWNRVMAEFENPQIGLVGFGGALGHGSPELYKTPYDYRQLGRTDYLSNTDDAEIHGMRFDGVCDVAVLDGFALIVRRSILLKAGGWPLNTPIGYSLYDYWLCAETHRQGYRIRLIGAKCVHLGGQTAVKLGKAEGQGKAHEDAHLWLYQNYPDVLPYRA